jgi:hypothetical protein
MKSKRCILGFVATLTVVAWAALAIPAGARGLLDKVAGFVGEQLVSWASGKVIDFVAAKLFGHELEASIPPIVAEIGSTVGLEREGLQEKLDLTRQQLAVLQRLIDSNGTDISGLKAEQESLTRRISSLDARMNKLEGRVDKIDSYVADLDARVSRLEEATIRECLDLRHASVFGKDGFRVKELQGAWSSEHFESESLTVDIRLMLNSCSGDLTQRGLLIQLQLVTRSLSRDMSLYATFKGVQNGGGMRVQSRQEIPLARPGYPVDGQVVELFFPYNDIPRLSLQNRLALALVLTHDGNVLYSLPDHVVSCVAGQRVNCRWMGGHY